MCRQLVERNFGHGVGKGKETEFKDDDSLYRLLEDDETTALNSGMSSLCEPRPAPEVAEELRRLILKLYSQFLSKDGKVSVVVEKIQLVPRTMKSWRKSIRYEHYLRCG